MRRRKHFAKAGSFEFHLLPLRSDLRYVIREIVMLDRANSILVGSRLTHPFWLSVNFAQNDIDAAKDRHAVGHLPATHHMRDGLQVHKGWRPQVEAIGVDGPVTDKEPSQRSTWRFNLRV